MTLDFDAQIESLQKDYEQSETGVKQDLGEVEGERQLDAGAWVDIAVSTAQFAGKEISQKARVEWLRRQGLSRDGQL